MGKHGSEHVDVFCRFVASTWRSAVEEYPLLRQNNRIPTPRIAPSLLNITKTLKSLPTLVKSKRCLVSFSFRKLFGRKRTHVERENVVLTHFFSNYSLASLCISYSVSLPSTNLVRRHNTLLTFFYLKYKHFSLYFINQQLFIKPCRIKLYLLFVHYLYLVIIDQVMFIIR